MFKDDIMAPLPIPHPFFFTCPFTDLPPTILMSSPDNGLCHSPLIASDSNSNKTPLNLTQSFLIISRPINPTPLNYGAKFYHV